MKNQTKKGFTLIELLVVISIIGLLASIVLVSLGSARAKSRDAKRISDMRQMSTALELYFNDYGGYPVNGNLTGTATSLAPQYVGYIPAAPTPPDGGCQPTSPGNPYTYAASGTPYSSGNGTGAQVVSSYSFTFCLGNSAGSYSSGVHVLTPAGIQ